MPRIGTGYPTSSSELSYNEAPASGTPGVGSAGRRERHGVLGLLARPFRKFGSSMRASGGPSAGTSRQQEQAPAPRAAALLNRSPLVGRGNGEEALRRAMLHPTGAPSETRSSSVQNSASTPHARGTTASALAGWETDPLKLIRGADAARARLVMPERGDGDDNAIYAWRVLSLNHGASLGDIAAVAIRRDLPPIEQLRWTIGKLKQMIETRDAICAAFSGLRSISKTDAESLGYKDAKDHGADDASTSLFFAEELSTSNPNQRVIALASQPSEPSNDFSADDNKGVAFTDLNELAHYLASEPKHPILPDKALHKENIARYAFRIE